MSYSLNEIAALAKRAARGAGLPWGLAEEAAMAARWLAAFDLPGPLVLADLLVRHEGVELAEVSPAIAAGVWSGPDWLSPLTTGPALSDRAAYLADAGSLEINRVTHPLLMLPFVAAAARQIGSSVSLNWGGVYLASDGMGLSLKADISALSEVGPKDVVCVVDAHMLNPVKPGHRGQVSQGCMDALLALAQNSFAPATEASRLLGAGADQNDND